MSLRLQLSGTGVAIVTPFKSTMEVDFDALGKLIDFNIPHVLALLLEYKSYKLH